MATSEATPSASSLEQVEEGQDGKAEKKRKFKPLEAMRKFFRSSKKRSKDVTKDEDDLKARSTSALLTESGERGNSIKSQTRSISEDSIFQPDQRDAHKVSTEQFAKGAKSAENVSQIFKNELANKLKKRQSFHSDDDGLPKSPASSFNTADSIMAGYQLQVSTVKSASRESDQSLLSVGSSENEEDLFQTNWKATVASVVTRRTDKITTELPMSEELSVVQPTTALKSDAARHRISVAPKARRGHGKKALLQKNPNVSSLPKLTEESPKSPSGPSSPSTKSPEVSAKVELSPVEKPAEDTKSKPEPSVSKKVTEGEVLDVKVNSDPVRKLQLRSTLSDPYSVINKTSVTASVTKSPSLRIERQTVIEKNKADNKIVETTPVVKVLKPVQIVTAESPKSTHKQPDLASVPPAISISLPEKVAIATPGSTKQIDTTVESIKTQSTIHTTVSESKPSHAVQKPAVSGEQLTTSTNIDKPTQDTNKSDDVQQDVSNNTESVFKLYGLKAHNASPKKVVLLEKTTITEKESVTSSKTTELTAVEAPSVNKPDDNNPVQSPTKDSNKTNADTKIDSNLSPTVPDKGINVDVQSTDKVTPAHKYVKLNKASGDKSKVVSGDTKVEKNGERGQDFPHSSTVTRAKTVDSADIHRLASPKEDYKAKRQGRSKTLPDQPSNIPSDRNDYDNVTFFKKKPEISTSVKSEQKDVTLKSNQIEEKISVVKSTSMVDKDVPVISKVNEKEISTQKSDEKLVKSDKIEEKSIKLEEKVESVKTEVSSPTRKVSTSIAPATKRPEPKRLSLNDGLFTNSKEPIWVALARKKQSEEARKKDKVSDAVNKSSTKEDVTSVSTESVKDSKTIPSFPRKTSNETPSSLPQRDLKKTTASKSSVQVTKTVKTETTIAQSKTSGSKSFTIDKIGKTSSVSPGTPKKTPEVPVTPVKTLPVKIVISEKTTKDSSTGSKIEQPEQKETTTKGNKVFSSTGSKIEQPEQKEKTIKGNKVFSSTGSKIDQPEQKETTAKENKILISKGPKLDKSDSKDTKTVTTSKKKDLSKVGEIKKIEIIDKTVPMSASTTISPKSLDLQAQTSGVVLREKSHSEKCVDVVSTRSSTVLDMVKNFQKLQVS